MDDNQPFLLISFDSLYLVTGGEMKAVWRDVPALSLEMEKLMPGSSFSDSLLSAYRNLI